MAGASFVNILILSNPLNTSVQCFLVLLSYCTLTFKIIDTMTKGPGHSTGQQLAYISMWDDTWDKEQCWNIVPYRVLMHLMQSSDAHSLIFGEIYCFWPDSILCFIQGCFFFGGKEINDLMIVNFFQQHLKISVCFIKSPYQQTPTEYIEG